MQSTTRFSGNRESRVKKETISLEEDNTINIVYLDDTPSSSNSDGIQSESEIDDPLKNVAFCMYCNYYIIQYCILLTATFV